MSKRLRLFGKKRGERRSVPRWVGRAGEVGFFAALLLAGVAAFGYILVDYLLPEWWANRNFAESTCQVLASEVQENTEVEGVRRFRPRIQIKYVTDGGVRGPTWTYDARFAYEYDRETAHEIIADFKTGEHYACWYDPINPANVVVVRTLSIWSWLWLLVPMAVAGFGGYGLVRSVLMLSLSPERRVHTITGSAAREGSRRAMGTAKRATSFPAVPAIEDIVNSPGTHLAFRLPSDSSPGWRTGGLAAMAIFFAVVLVVLLSHAAQTASSWSEEFAELLFLVPLVAIAVGLTRYAVQEWLRNMRCGSSRLEVSEHPFLPGETYQLLLVQSGKMKVRRLEVQLICQEEATFSPGTDTRVAREIVHRDVLLRKDHFDIRPGAAFEAPCELHIPDRAMHSFVAEHNRVDWFLVVRIRLAGGGFDRRYPVCVYPVAAASQAGPHRPTSVVSS
jgi:hypothetical protein